MSCNAILFLLAFRNAIAEGGRRRGGHVDGFVFQFFQRFPMREPFRYSSFRVILYILSCYTSFHFILYISASHVIMACSHNKHFFKSCYIIMAGSCVGLPFHDSRQVALYYHDSVTLLCHDKFSRFTLHTRSHPPPMICTINVVRKKSSLNHIEFAS